MNEVIGKASCKYENLIVMGDFNVDILKVLILTKISWKKFVIFLI